VTVDETGVVVERELGQWWLRQTGSRPGYFWFGVTAVLKEGTIPLN